MSHDETTDDAANRRSAAEDRSVTHEDVSERRTSRDPVGELADWSPHRLYGAERFVVDAADDSRGILSLRELRYLQHASRFDRAQRNSLYSLLDRRLEQFIETEWPVIADEYPEYAERLREAVCETSAE